MKTKEHILEVATKLFGKHGFSGVSVRDIAKEADVNVAAINYHFKNKKLLLEEVFKYSYEWLQNEITIIAEDDVTLKQLAHKTLQLFLENRMKCLNTFRIFISDDLELSEDFFENTAPSGPPGSGVFLKVLTKELGEDIKLEKREWAVRAIFDYVCHTGIVVSTMALKDRTDHYPWMASDIIEKETYDMVESITRFLPEKS